MAGDPIIAAAAILNAAAAVTALVGTSIDPLVTPQDVAPPAVTMTPITTIPQNHYSGDGSLDVTRMQVNSWGTTYAQARAVANAVRAAFLASNVLLLVDHPDFNEVPVPGRFCVIQEFEIWS